MTTKHVCGDLGFIFEDAPTRSTAHMLCPPGDLARWITAGAAEIRQRPKPN